LKTAYLRELESSSNFRLGSGGSRLLDGNSAYAEQLEKDIAAFHGAPSGLLFNSGFDANSGFFSCVPQPGDLIFHDEHIHASVHEGMRLSRAGARVSFAHNSVEDLRGKLFYHIQNDPLIEAGLRSIFIAIESLYSMDGDLAPLREIVELVDEVLPAGNGHIIVDEAHSNGVYGFQGRGIISSLGLENRIFARLHTFGKGLACNGGMSAKHKIRTTLTYESNSALLESYKRISDQLCQEPDLHYRNVLPITGRY
jgi:8-amino-7-oxononanoate synthase